MQSRERGVPVESIGLHQLMIVRPRLRRTVSCLLALAWIGLPAPVPDWLAGIDGVSPAAAQAVPRVAVLDFVGEDVDVGTVDLIADLFRQEMSVSDRVDLIDAGTMRSTLGGAQRCFVSGCASSQGRDLGAARVVVGRVSRRGNPFRLELRGYDVASGRQVASVRRDLESEEAMFLAVPQLAPDATQWMRRELPEEEPPPPEPAPPPVAAVRIEHDPVERARQGEGLSIEASVVPSRDDLQVLAMFRVPGEGRLRYVTMRHQVGDSYEAEIPASAVGRAGVEYYIHVVDSAGNPMSRFPEGSEYLSVESFGTPPPSSRPPVEPPDTPAAPAEDGTDEGGGSKWWLIGGAVAAVGVVVALVAGGGGDGDGNDPPVVQPLPEPPEHE